MALLLSDVITGCREMLQDTDDLDYRWTEVRLYNTMNAVLGEVWRLRPDLFIANDWELPRFTPADSAEEFPIAASYFQPVVNLVVGYVQLENDAITPDGKAMTLVSMAKAMFQGGA